MVSHSMFSLRWLYFCQIRRSHCGPWFLWMMGYSTTFVRNIQITLWISESPRLALVLFWWCCFFEPFIANLQHTEYVLHPYWSFGANFSVNIFWKSRALIANVWQHCDAGAWSRKRHASVNACLYSLTCHSMSFGNFWQKNDYIYSILSLAAYAKIVFWVTRHLKHTFWWIAY